MDGVQTAVVSTCISCKTGTWRRVRVCVCVYVFALCVVWHIFTEGCVLSLSFGVIPEAMSNWSLHTFRLDSHWHARPWLCSLCHEKGKQCQKHAFFFTQINFAATYSFLCFPSLCFSFVPVSFKRLWCFLHLRRWTFQLLKKHLKDIKAQLSLIIHINVASKFALNSFKKHNHECN